MAARTAPACAVSHPANTWAADCTSPFSARRRASAQAASPLSAVGGGVVVVATFVVLDGRAPVAVEVGLVVSSAEPAAAPMGSGLSGGTTVGAVPEAPAA